MRTIKMARYALVKGHEGKTPKMKVSLLDEAGKEIAHAYLIIYRRYCLQMVDENNNGDLGASPVMCLDNLASLPDKYQASIIINMMAEFAIQKFVQDTLTDPDVTASNTNFYDNHNYNTLGRFTEECLQYLFPEYQKYGIENNFLYHNDSVDYDID